MKHVNRFSRLLSLVMVVAMLLSMMPASIFAVESTQTVYFQNNWMWTDVRVHYWGDGESAWPGAVMTVVENDGTYDICSAEIPANVTGIIFNGVKNDGSGNRDQTPDIKDDAIVSGNKCYYMTWNNGNSYGTFDYTPPVTAYAVTFNGTNVTSNGAATAAVGEDYTATLTAAAAYALPVSVSVSIGGAELSEGYTYDAESGALSIDAAAVTGDIVITAVADAITYLKPNSNWLIDGARFAVYCFGNGNKWVNMTDTDGDGYYEVVLPEGYPNVIFCRMNPSNTANDWNYKWNQTADLTVPTDGSNCYTVKEGTWDKGGGTWSTYIPETDEGGDEPDVPVVPDNEYFLVGYLNNADYSGNEYKFVDGKLTVTFTADSYVAVKETSGDWYLAESYCTDTTVTLIKGKSEKMFVPGNTELEFTLVANADGTLTLSYTKVEAPVVPEATYIIAGSGMFGTEWDPANTANQMTLNADGLYEKVYTNVAAGTYEFKVTDGTWNNSWGNGTGNYSITVEEESNVTILFNEQTKVITVNVEPVAAELSTDYYLVGYLNNADYSGNNYKFEKGKLTVKFNATSYVMIKNAAGKTYYFKTYCTAATGTLYGSGANEKMNVPGGLDLTFTLAENADGTLTLSYEVAEPEVPADAEYYLVGYINGKDYGIEGDSANLGDYKFVDGKLSVKFTQDSYVVVKSDSNVMYCAQTYSTGKTVTLKAGYSEKLFVPGNTELTFSLVTNEDGTLTLSYETGAVETPEDASYYLVGYLNNADYAGENYAFVDGKLTVTFNADSYVYVKDNNNANYMAETYCQDTTVTLAKGNAEKMFVPGNTELTFTLVENGDGTLTLSYSVKTDVPEIPEGSNVVTIHFLKPSNWSGNVNAWVWDDNGAIPGFEIYQTAWPGSPIPANADKAGWYDLVIGTAAPQAFNFIFNNGSSQTPDLTTGAITGPTELWVVGENVYTAAPLEWTHYTATIHFQKPGDWGDTVAAYMWTDTDEKLLGEWPGTVATSSINEGWYTAMVRVEIGRTLNFIFNNNNGKQTADLTAGKLAGNVELWIDGSGNSVSAPAGWIDASRTVHVPGTFPGPSWDAASNEMTYDPTLGLYVITFKNVTAGTYEYKIAINGAWSENYGEGGVRDGNNIRVSVPSKQDVTIWYSDVSHRSVCSVDYDINAVVSLTGAGIPEDTKMSDPNLSGLFTATVKLAVGTYSDVTITFGDYTYTFAEFELANEKEVTFYFDPSTYLAYHNASDKKVETDKLFFDTKDLQFKDPFGAVPTNTDVTFAIETGEDATQVSLIVKGRKGIAMTKDGEAVDGVQRWVCTVQFDRVGEYQYYFAITNGSDMVFYTDDNYNNYYRKGDYGTGTVRDINNLFPYDLVVYYAGFSTPDWMKDAVIYQIFPDRFFDGNESNNQAQTDARGSVDYEYVSNWYLLPENPEQAGAPTYVYQGDGEWSNEIYGGDLEGITERIGYLKSLGVTVIYLNPVFSSISNHRYDACDYMEIDPILGTLGDFEELVAVAEANGMKIILDGVFNHVSDDSVYFDRYYKFLGTSEKIGAYPYWAYVYDYMAENGVALDAAEAAAKAYFGENYGITDYSYTEWFAVSSKQGTYADKIGLRAGKLVYTYEGWWGYDSMPVIKSTNGSEYQTGNWAEEVIRNAEGDSVTQYWISKGNDGWRLDVANEVSDETWVHFRNSVKALNSNAVIIGEIWSDATHYLMGNMYDSVMNYVFRDAVAGFARGYLINRDNKAEKYDSDLTAEEALTILEILRERYPEEAFYAMMNLVGSHDTSRILSYLDDVEDDRYQKDQASAFPLYSTTSSRAKQLQYVVAFIQYTYAGAPTVYYGDEIGMVGGDDPDDRRAFEWGKGNKELVEWYAKLAAIRRQYPALRTGDVKAFAPTADVMGYVRSDAADTLIVMANRASGAASVELDLEELGVSASTLTDLVTGKSYTVTDGKVTVSVDAYRGVILTENVKGYSVNYGGLAPAYDVSYIVGGRASSTNMVYPFLNGTGADRKVISTKTEDLVFEVEAVVNTFTHITVDGETVDPDNYTVKTGTVVTLKADYLKTLTLGDHELVIHFQGGQTNAVKITVEEETKPTEPTKPSTPEDDEDDPTTAPTTKPTTPDDKVPTTGDSSNVIVWVMVMVVALAAIVALVVIGLKKKKK